MVQLANLVAYYDAGFEAFSRESDQSTLTEHSLLAAAVAWEGFVSDIFVAYINRDATKFKAHLKDSFVSHIKGSLTQKKVFDSFGQLVFPAHLKKSDVLALANSLGNNITFPSFVDLERRANAWLTPVHARKFTMLSGQEKAVVNALIALRNHIAHRSQRSLDAMNDALANGALYPTGIQRLNNKFHNVGAWLKATPVGSSQTRFKIIIDVLDAIGRSF